MQKNCFKIFKKSYFLNDFVLLDSSFFFFSNFWYFNCLCYPHINTGNNTNFIFIWIKISWIKYGEYTELKLRGFLSFIFHHRDCLSHDPCIDHLHVFVGLDCSPEVCPLPGGASGKEPTCLCKRHKRHGFDPWVRKIPWRKAWKPTQYSCLENPMDREAWWATAHRVAKSWTWQKWLSMHTHTYTYVYICIHVYMYTHI